MNAMNGRWCRSAAGDRPLQDPEALGEPPGDQAGQKPERRGEAHS
jgi:hypothetical protein